MEKTQNYLTKNLKTLRNKSGLKQREVAEALDIDEKTYARYERGEYEPSEAMKTKIAKLFNATVVDLYRGEKSDLRTDDRASLLTSLYSVAPTLAEDKLREVVELALRHSR